MKAIVLAAGKGTRLQPLTDNRPKHLLEIAGVPILKRILDELLSTDIIDEIVIVVHYKHQLIKEALTDWYPEQTFKIVYQEEPKGTGDAVDSALSSVTINDQFVVINGDVVFGESLVSILDQFLQHGDTPGMILGFKVLDARMYGVLYTDGYKLTKIVEKPDNPPPDAIINAGMYVLPPEAVSLFNKLQPSSRGERELTDVIDTLLEQERDIFVHAMTTQWFDVGKPWDLLAANEYFMDKEKGSYKIMGTVEDGAMLRGDVYVAETARIRSGVYIEGPVFIDEGADIGPNCYIRGKTYLGKQSRIGNACEIKNSIIYKDTHAAHLSYVGDSILGEQCNLGAGTITANLRHDGKNIKFTVKDKREDTKRRKLGTVLGDQVKIGIGVSILPGVKISSGTWINAGEIISRDC